MMEAFLVPRFMAGPPFNFRQFVLISKSVISGSDGTRKGFHHLTVTPKIVIFFSLTEAPLTDPTTTPPNTPEMDPKRTGTDPKRRQTEPNGAERSQTEPKWTEIKPSRVGRPGGFVGMGRGGGCKGKRISLT